MGNVSIAPVIKINNDDEIDIENNKNVIFENFNNDNISNYEKWDNSLKNVKNVKKMTIVINKNIKGIIYKNKEEYGDFNWMIETGDYKNTLFIFDDNVDEYNKNIEDIKDNGLSNIRKYNEFGTYAKISSAGIIMGSSFNNGFSVFDNNVKNIIDRSITDIKRTIIENNYNEIYFSSDENGDIKPSYYNVSKDIIKYVSEQIFLLNDLLEKV